MKYLLGVFWGLSAVSAQTVLVPTYGQCGGLSYNGPWECEPGSTCSPVGSEAFPSYQCYPDVGPIVPHAFPYAQCGGLLFTGPTVCTPGWTCTVSNAYFSTCVQNANTTTPSDPTPDLANPGSRCENMSCVPGFTCSGPGVYGYYVCLRATSSSSSTPAASSTILATLSTSTRPLTSAVQTTLITSKASSTSKIASTSKRSSTRPHHT